MDTFTISLLTACGVSLTGAIGILWKWGLGKDDKIFTLMEAQIEQDHTAKTQNENIQALLVALKGTTESIFSKMSIIDQNLLKALRKGK